MISVFPLDSHGLETSTEGRWNLAVSISLQVSDHSRHCSASRDKARSFAFAIVFSYLEGEHHKGFRSAPELGPLELGNLLASFQRKNIQEQML